ncbi:translation initiation factor IF-2-like [Lagopus muta]|uniref:translation initiation factor IF-2-like n=1 Tax=Lagopus muta TaxID=64668 RepID=UPI00209FE26D|nr:translation initiation factor IF-2-like [Lagopus muta]
MWEPRRETGKFHGGVGPRAAGTARRRDPGPASPGATTPGGPADPERSRPAGRKTKEKGHVRGRKAEGRRGERSLEFIFTFSPGAAGSGSLGGGAGAPRRQSLGAQPAPGSFPPHPIHSHPTRGPGSVPRLAAGTPPPCAGPCSDGSPHRHRHTRPARSRFGPGPAPLPASRPPQDTDAAPTRPLSPQPSRPAQHEARLAARGLPPPPGAYR